MKQFAGRQGLQRSLGHERQRLDSHDAFRGHVLLCAKRQSLDNHDILNRSVTGTRPCASNLVHDIHASDDLAKDGVLSIQVWGWCEGDEELAAVCAGSAVGHGKDALCRMNERAVNLILELAAVDGLSAAASPGGVTALNHEVWDDAVEDYAVVLASIGEACEVLACLRRKKVRKCVCDARM